MRHLVAQGLVHSKDHGPGRGELLDRGLFSINEAREVWNLAPVENGDTRVIRGEYYSADDKLTPTEEINDGSQE